jgi:hypothetical protein
LAAGPFAGTTTGAYTVAGGGQTQHWTASEVILSDFDSFLGTGSKSFSVSVHPGTGTYSGAGAGYLFFGGAFNAYGTVEIDYTYSPIPEARHFSLCTGGLAGAMAIGGWVRRLRRTPAPA